jgi:hypothetical protein
LLSFSPCWQTARDTRIKIVDSIVLDKGLVMKAVEPAGCDPVRVPASPEVVALATELVRNFSECFWFWHPEARVRYEDDARLVIGHLREYGDKRAWAAAKELKKCL